MTRSPLRRLTAFLLAALLPLAAALLLSACTPDKIDRHALVTRNNPRVDALAPLNSLNLGNGAFTLTLDATGLQTFPEFCKDGLSLGTFSEWGWHAFPNTEGYTQEETLEDHPLPGHPHGIYSVQEGYGLPERGRAAATWVRENPHRLHLGNVGFEGMLPEEIDGVDQTLDMWDGVLHSSFRWKGLPVEVETVSGGEGEDLLAARIRAEKPLPVVIRFPYPTGEHSDDASDWCADERHTTEILAQDGGSALLRRTLDGTVYHVALRWSGKATLEQSGPNRLTLTPAGRRYVDGVREIMTLEKNLRGEIAEMASDHRATLRIGISASRSVSLLPRILPEFMKRWPLVGVELKESPSVHLEELLEKGGCRGGPEWRARCVRL